MHLRQSKRKSAPGPRDNLKNADCSVENNRDAIGGISQVSDF